MENIIFGIRPVAEAIESHKQIERIYIRKGAEGQLIDRPQRPVHALPPALAGGAGRSSTVSRARQSSGRRGTDGGHRVCRAERYFGARARRRDSAGGRLRRCNRRAQLRRHSPLGRVRRRPRPHSSAQKLSTGQCRCDQGVGRCSEQDTGMPRGVDPQHA